MGPTHWDLMIESGDSLATWQLAQRPAPRALREGMDARRIADHRSAYLSYEGSLSGGRGEVRAVERGRARVVQAGEDRWIVKIQGEGLVGTLEIARQAGEGRWRLTLAGPPPQAAQQASP